MTLPYSKALEMFRNGYPFKPANATTSGDKIFLYPGPGTHNWLLPSLEEVIVELGKQFDSLDRGTNGHFCAKGYPISHFEDGSGLLVECGVTTLEAACNLWLAVNRKPQE